MGRTIPLIRAAVLFPMIRWMRENGRDPSGWLATTGLGELRRDMQECPVPLLKVFDSFRVLAANEGPEICAKVISHHSLEDLGTFGRVILGSRTLREALTRARHCLPRYSTHEILALRSRPGGLCVEAGWSLIVDDETLHLTQQFTAALIAGLCFLALPAGPGPTVIRIRPHPRWGLDHLLPVFGTTLQASDKPVLSVELDDTLLDAPMQIGNSTPDELPPLQWVMPKGERSFSTSVSLALQTSDLRRKITIDQAAGLAGMSVRSFQRALTAEGASFRALLDDRRRDQTLLALSGQCQSGRFSATELGYSGRSPLSRAVRRWTGASPRQLKLRDEDPDAVASE